MPVSIYDIYSQAAITGNWGFALMATQVINDDGNIASPSSNYDYESLMMRADALEKYRDHPEVSDILSKLKVNLEKCSFGN